jgi:3-oxoacyl-[acyl-carrier protein] reductase
MRNAVVTGATSGIGRAIALKLSENGYQVFCAGRDRLRAAEVLATVKGRNGRAIFWPVDVGNPTQVERLFAALQKENLPLTVLVNAAGIEKNHEDPLDTRFWEETFRINLYGAVEFIRHSLKFMKEGVIVNIASLVGSPRVVFPTYSLAYEASKAALHKVTESIAVTHAPDIRAVTVSPGYVDTPIWDKFPKGTKEESAKLVPIGRFIKPEEIAEAVYMVIENPAFNGVDVAVDGGLSLRKVV